MSQNSRKFFWNAAIVVAAIVIAVSFGYFLFRPSPSETKLPGSLRPAGGGPTVSPPTSRTKLDWTQIDWRRDIFALNNVATRPVPTELRGLFVVEFSAADRLADKETDGPTRLKSRQKAISLALKHRDAVNEAIKVAGPEDRVELEVIAIEAAYWGRDFADAAERSQRLLATLPLDARKKRKIVYSLWTNAEIMRVNSVEAKRVVELSRAELGSDALNLLSPIDRDGALRAAASSLERANSLEDQYLNSNPKPVFLLQMIQRTRGMAVEDLSRTRYP